MIRQVEFTVFLSITVGRTNRPARLVLAKPKDTSILTWWCDKKENILYDVARVVLAVPATQISVERLFRALKYILNTQRSCLGSALLDDILLLRCNATIAYSDE